MAIYPILDSRLGFERGVIESSEFERSDEAADALAAQAAFRPEDAGVVIRMRPSRKLASARRSNGEEIAS